MKSEIEIAPVFHRLPERIRAHASICFMALILYRVMRQRLKAAGLKTIPGGGAEIFAPRVRRKICDDKATAEQWLEIHRTAHRLGIKSNATMLYGHIERLDERVDHMRRLRELQDETGGFLAYIPLAYHPDDCIVTIHADAEQRPAPRSARLLAGAPLHVPGRQQQDEGQDQHVGQEP